MARYIDADLLKLQIERGAEMTERGIRLLDLSQQPTADVVPVVRCKDCEWFHLDDGGYCGQGQCCCNENGFCSYGERREEDGKIH